MRSGSQVLVHRTILPDRGGKECVLDDVLDLFGVEDGEHDWIANRCNVGDGCGAPAHLRQSLGFRRIDVEADDGKARRHEAARIDLTHQAQADQSYRLTLGHRFAGSSRITACAEPSCDSTGDRGSAPS